MGVTQLRRPRPILWLREHGRAADWLLALVVTALAVALHFADLADDEVRDPTWWTPIFVVGSTLPIAWRRTSTITSGIVVVAVQVVASLLDIDGTGFLGVLIAIYSIGAHTAGVARRNTAIGIAVVLLALFVMGIAAGEFDIGGFVSSVVVLVTAFVLGDNLRRRRERADSLVERAERAERERDLIAQQRVNAERTRIARELHDVVAHSVSVMVIQSAAARRNLTSDPDSAEAALATIEDTGRSTMQELRSILGVLRTGADGTAERLPQPSLADLAALVAANDDLPIELHVVGEMDDLPQTITLTGYRVVQEALTNVRRHGGLVNHVRVGVTQHDDGVVIEVIDDGRGAAAESTQPGYGIVGMRERVAAVGGRFGAAPRTGGGWRVEATLPFDRTPPVVTR